MLCGDAVDRYTVEGLHIGGGYAYAGCTGTVDGRIGIVRGGRCLCGVRVLRMRVRMCVLETKGVGEGIGGREIVIWGSTGAVWNKEAAHGVSAARDDDGVGMGTGRGTGAGYVRRDGVGTTVAASGSGRTDGRCAGP